MATENDDLSDLEREIDATDAVDEPKEEDFTPAEPDDEPGAEPDDEPAAARAAAPEISDDLEVARNQAADMAQQCQEYLGAKQAALDEARKKLAEANDSAADTHELVAAQEALQVAVLEQREAAAWMAKAHKDYEAAARPRAPAAQKWIDRNPRFKTDSAFRERAERIAGELSKDYRNDGDLMYQELDRRLRSKVAMGNRSARSGGAPTSRQPGRANADAQAPSQFDRKWMRNIGLDSSNKAHLKEWKKNYAELVAEG